MMQDCPCCSHSMLRHVRHHEVYWFCRSCWQEMPLLEPLPQLGLLAASLERRFVSAAVTRSRITV